MDVPDPTLLGFGSCSPQTRDSGKDPSRLTPPERSPIRGGRERDVRLFGGGRLFVNIL